MSGNLIQLEKALRKIAKHSKTIKYTKGLLFAFIMMGMSAFSAEVTIKDKEIEQTKTEINDTVKDLKEQFRIARAENDKLLRNANLDLIQLMEQGDQVIKSPWSSWQFGINYMYDGYLNSGESYRGRGDKDDKYSENYVYDRSKWWETKINPTSDKYSNITSESNNNSSINNNRKSYLIDEWGLVKLNIPMDPGVDLEIIADVTPKLINRESIVVNTSAASPIVNATIPNINAKSFSPLDPKVNISSPFNPPALNLVSTGFWQGAELGFYAQNTVGLGNASAQANKLNGTEIIVRDNSFITNNAFDFQAYNDASSSNSTSPTGSRSTGGYSIQTFLNALAGSYTFSGNWTFRNETSNPYSGGPVGSSNTLRFISVNHAYGAVDKKTTFKLEGNLSIYGRSSGNHMTVGIEHQAYGSLAAEAINSGNITFSSGKNVIGMTAMIENYNDFTFGSSRYHHPEQSTLENTGSIVISNSVSDSIGMDFAQYSFAPTISASPYHNKGSLNIYAVPGNIVLNGSTSYGLRVPNIFNGGQDPNAIYYDETIINGEKQNGMGIEVNGNNNVGVSISKIISMFKPTGSTITETTEVYGYQNSQGVSIDRGSRNSDDLIGNIYNLNITVNGNQNVGFLRKSDYMSGSYNSDTLLRSQKDFVLKVSTDGTGHIQTANFLDSATDGVLFRTDKYGIDLAGDLKITGMSDTTYGTGSTHPNSNVVLLANETQTGSIITKTAVRNSKILTLGYSSVDTENGLVGLMSYNGAYAENKLGGTIEINSKNSIGIASMGVTSGSVVASEANNEGIINVNGANSVGIYNEGTFNTSNGEINSKGTNTIGIYSKDSSSVTNILGGKVTASNGGVGIYSGTGSTINLGDSGGPLTLNLESGDGGLFFYTKSGSGKYNLTEDIGLKVKSGGTAFYTTDLNSFSTAPLSTFFGYFFPISSLSPGKLNIDMENSNSTLFYVDGSSSPVYLSTLSIPSVSTLPSNINITGATDYRIYKAGRIELHIDRNLNLDDTTDLYNRSEFLSSKIYVDSGNEVTSAANNIAGIAQKNSLGGNQSDILINNSGTVKMSGTGTAGLITEFGLLTNNHEIEMTGSKSVGIIGADESLVTNNGKISISDDSIGIAGINYLPYTSPSTMPIYGNKGIDIVHNGEIISTGAITGNVGIYANNDTTVSGSSSAKVTLNSGSKIDISSAPSSIGVYLENVDLIDNGGDIKIGESGTGIFVANTQTPLHSVTMNSGGMIESTSDKSKGIYTDLDLTSTKHIKLSGKESIGIQTYQSSTGSPINSIINQGTIEIGNSSSTSSPSIGIYTREALLVDNQGTISVGDKSLGIYSSKNTGKVKLSSGSTLNVGEEGTGIYKQGGDLELDSGSVVNVSSGNTVGLYAEQGTTLLNNTVLNIGDSAFGFVLDGLGTNLTNTSSSTQNLGKDSVYVYTNNNSSVVNNTNVLASGKNNIALYGKNGSTITNNADINMGTEYGNIGIYTEDASTLAKNYGKITVGSSNMMTSEYSIGMAASNGSTIENHNDIYVTGSNSIGMYGDGIGTKVYNHGKIYLDATGASSTNPKNQMVGIYLDNGAYGENWGDIKTLSNYASNTYVSTLVGVSVQRGSIFENHGNIDIKSDNGVGIYVNNGIIKNYGSITVTGDNSTGVKYKNGEVAPGVPLTPSNVGGTVTSTGGQAFEELLSNPTATVGDVTISPDASGRLVATLNGVEIPTEALNPNVTVPSTGIIPGNISLSNVGIYVDTLGKTKPIEGTGFTMSGVNSLIIGAEIADITNSKAIRVGSNIISPFITSSLGRYQIYSGSLTWIATEHKDASGIIDEVLMAKIPYTDFTTDDNTYNFADGLEQRYDMNALNSREKEVFNKLNGIGKNESILLAQAYDEMMGHQYANTQQRLYTTSGLLNKEFDYLANEWATASKQSNKVKVFGMKGEYNTDTAGIIDYKNDAYGVAYLHEDETVKLGANTGWYAGVVHNIFKFKDIGGSREETTMGKLGIFKTTTFDNNGSLKWKISGEGMLGYSEMNRRFLVVDEIFGARSTYTSYGLALRNELSKEIRLSERTSLKPYGSIDIEYGRYGNIKEETGEVRLEVKGNDYYSIKPEVGIEYKYKQPMFVRTNLTASIGIAYENELGKVNDADNKARVAYTNADYFNLRGEKENREGNVKGDLKLGIENSRIGFTLDLGYDTKGENVRGGVGLRVIY